MIRIKKEKRSCPSWLFFRKELNPFRKEIELDDQ